MRLLSAVVSYLSPPPIGCWGRGCPAPKIFGNLRGIRQNIADSRAGWLNLSVGGHPTSNSDKTLGAATHDFLRKANYWLLIVRCSTTDQALKNTAPVIERVQVLLS